jgi:phosphate transport system substrate-binding protein
MRLIAGAQRLSLNFRFRTGSNELDNRALADLDRVSGFLSNPAHQHGGIILCGFADSQGSAETNEALASSRANAVAAEFKRRGMIPAAVNAFGATNPVASNKTEDGRQKNRRVEVWMRTM